MVNANKWKSYQGSTESVCNLTEFTFLVEAEKVLCFLDVVFVGVFISAKIKKYL